jgi:hypothetical protein
MSQDILTTADLTNPSEAVRFTQRARRVMFDELTEGGAKLTDNFKEVKELLKDVDATALLTRKLDIEESASNEATRALNNHRQLREMLGGRDPFRRDDDSPLPVAERVEGALPGQLPNVPVRFVPGELDQGEQQLVVADFVQQAE